MAKEKFKIILEQLNNRSYKDNSIEIETSEYDGEEAFKKRIGDEEVFHLCEALKQNPHVNEISFFLQDVGDKGAIALAEVSTIEIVAIMCGRLGVAGARALVESNNLKEFTIWGGDLFEEEEFRQQNTKKENTEEEKSFMETLLKNKSIEVLNLYDSYISKEQLVYLVENTTSIKHLSLSRYDFKAELLTELFMDVHINQEKIHIHGDKEIILLGDEIQEIQ